MKLKHVIKILVCVSLLCVVFTTTTHAQKPVDCEAGLRRCAAAGLVATVGASLGGPFAAGATGLGAAGHCLWGYNFCLEFM
ncbi:hypothetical protein KAR48_18725 [bacterium]|nr:hypothetical protein [bacterium]